MAFKLKSGNKVDFKSMGSSPARNMKDGSYSQSFEKTPMKKTMSDEEANAYAASKGNYDTPVDAKKTLGKVVPVVEEEEVNTAGDLSSAVVKTPKPAETSLSDGLNETKQSEENDKLRAQSKKEMYANAWQNSGAGHITEAVKSIGRGIKNVRAKNKAKKAEKLTSAKEAIEDGTQTLKQQKRVDRSTKKSVKKEAKASERKNKDQEKLVKYKAKKAKKAVKKFKKNTVVKNSKTHAISKKTTANTTPTDAELMAHHEANRSKQGKSTL